MASVLALVLTLAAHAERHRVFVEEEAHFLLTADERARFDVLETEELKDRFIEAFWRRWDRGAHLERLLACDRLFGVRGRWSERGRIFQLLGAPSFREDFTRAGNRVVPSELWHYTGVDVPFLPDAFYLIFFQRGGAGELRLWSPVIDGVSALVASTEPSGVEIDADARLARIDPELALAVEGLVPGGDRRDALSLLASVDAFAELYERDRVFGEDVRVAVTTRELPVSLMSAVFVDDAGVAELHYALDLAPGASEQLCWRAHAERYRVRFTLIGRVMGHGAAALERERWEDSIELDVTKREKQSLSTTRLSFRGRRLVLSSDERFELALVTEGAGKVVSGPIEIVDTAEKNEGRARGFARDVGGASEIVRVLERTRTRAEEGRYRFARGIALARRGERERAIEELESAIDLGVDDVGVHVELARLLYAARRYEDVLDRFGALTERFRGDVDVWVLMAASAEALGRFEVALRYYDRAVELAPDNGAIAMARDQVRAHWR